jgi:hypothetical protein
MITCAADNLINMNRMVAVQEVKTLFILGYGLDIKMENELPHGYISWTDIGERLHLTARHIKLGRRVYQMFKLWLDAVDHLNQVSMADIDNLTEEETQVLILRLIMSQPTDQNYPLGHIII